MLRTIFFAGALVAFSSAAADNQVSTKEANPFKQTMWYFTEMHLNQAGPDDVLFFGDSLVQGMNMDGLKFKAVNMGIGGYTLAEIANRMKAVRVQDYRAIIVEGGVNDVIMGRNDEQVKAGFDTLFSEAGRSKRFYFAQMLPANKVTHTEVNNRVETLNKYSANLCSKSPKCILIKSPTDMWKNNKPDYYFPDGVHLKKLGYESWIKEINKAV
jgi:lysophospholipase L1-like esterase